MGGKKEMNFDIDCTIRLFVLNISIRRNLQHHINLHQFILKRSYTMIQHLCTSLISGKLFLLSDPSILFLQNHLFTLP
jgi:hypothetical protein